ncbi:MULTISPECIES: sensor histidine kinase [Helicobacter]|uniref:histidine kinase n=4 Tax=Helicobacter typhlonius TaxID=76936 RepID=A0A099UI47_9HELI|nr:MULTISPECIES: HAMP domain-containing sensor histidine kinase [Helicobacter]TLD78068.1 HAMP domain-containing histidine kinase [Helicobacter typhlonius]TLD86254.1 HAMP domain-containing histidine kinase [Helicobacter sp. MIT 03-1616]CUU39557.1 Putative two-component sensor histidine kinase [Helicobacter typhlonius]HCD73548.1 sensor histidine kinase [Helicobacter sp.]
MSIVHSLMNKISFKAKTTILVWIIVVGFVLVASVALLALLGLKSEFDTNSLGNLYTPNKNAQEQNKNNQDDIAHLSYMWILEPKAQNKIDNMDSLILHLRKQYAQTFMSKEYDAVKELLQKQQQVRESAKIAITNNDIPAISALLKEQIILSSDITFYNKAITDTLYNHTFVFLVIFMFIVIATIIILALSIRHSINTNHLLLEQLVDSKTKELQALNANLQESIQYEVEQNRKKDLIMYQQARLASMGEMIQNIAHQWRQPLNSLTMLIQSFKSKAMQNRLDDDFVLQQTQYGMKIATEMSNTIENFRNFFRPEANTEPFVFITSIEDSIELLKERLKENLIKINVVAKKENLSIDGYQNSFMQVILILINNAIDALKLRAENEKDFTDLCIEILLDKVGYNIVLCVRDNAGGIRLEDKSKVFEPYFTTKHKSVGTGIGLYMAEQIIERQFNGTIDVSNTQWGEAYFGAEFTIHIPTQGGKV